MRAATTASLERVALAATDDPTVGVDAFGLWVENDFRDVAEVGSLVDVCVGNGVDDIDGTPVVERDDPSVGRAFAANVTRQQDKINALFAPFGTGEIAVDGQSGSITGQRLCAARVALGLDISTADMMPGSDEQATFLAAETLPTPNSTGIESERWILIDRTCQMMFIGAGRTIAYVFPTSTGSEGFETRLQDRAEVFRFNPAFENGGWHDSSEFPVGVDNPRNGNMYKPLYFDLGQAIHGANNVPTSPDSKGCARLSVDDQNTLVTWLGLADAQEETWRKPEMNVTVNVQGEFTPR